MSNDPKTPIALPNTPQWNELRKMGIGASEAAAACGMSKYMPAAKLYHLKKGEVDGFEGSMASRMGKRLESLILEEYVFQTGVHILAQEPGLFRHEDHKFMLATPDAFIENESGGFDELVEIKTIHWRIAADLGEENTDQIPIEWLFQANQQMEVLGASVCHFGVYVDNNTLKKFRIERNDDLISCIIEREKELWERIENDDPPPIDWEHRKAVDLVKELHGDITKDAIVLSEAAGEKWAEYELLGKRIKELDTKRNACRARVLDEIGDNFAGVLPCLTKMIRRKRVKESTYTVNRKSFVDARKVNCKINDQKLVENTYKPKEVEQTGQMKIPSRKIVLQ